MNDNGYTLDEIKDYAVSKVSKGIGYALFSVGGVNMLYDAIERDVNIGTVFNTLFAVTGLALASGLENKLLNREAVSDEIAKKTGY